MSRSGLWLSWLLIFVGFTVLGGGIGYVLMSFWGPHNTFWEPWSNQNQPRTIINENFQKISDYKYYPPDNYESDYQPITNIKNPFTAPSQNNDTKGQNVPFNKKQTFLEYQGIIETNNSIFGLVKVTHTGEVFVVYEGENLVEFEIRKITPKTLTYSKDGIEAVIPLGGKLH